MEVREIFKELEKKVLADKEILTVDEACTYTGMKKRTIYKLVKSGKIKGNKPNNKQIFIEKQALTDWLLGR